ncbi:MAG: transcriptional repressor [Melioribacteraceae bacterium]|nr:transcriptional repressor [Melioribacteraceae bacterium]
MNKEKAHDEFKLFLKAGKHRITPERFEVLSYAFESGDHFTADDLYLEMKNGKSNVSRATVYNSLELLVKCEMLAKRNFGENKTFYESSYNRKNHVHLICKECGEIIESNNIKVAELVNSIAKKNNFINESFQFNILGKCKKHSK